MAAAERELAIIDSHAPGLIRLVVCGSVDDGKSTLIGRLLHDSGHLAADTIAHVESTSARRGDGRLDLALLTDGLRAEREQGITIDVAYRAFQAGGRRFLLADAPGHVQYTRNMITAASSADAAVVLIDVRNGIVEQTRRHLAILAELAVRHVVVAINKIDLLEFAEAPVRAIERELDALADALELARPVVVPICARDGDNLLSGSTRTPWYDGAPLVTALERVEIDSVLDHPARLPVQWVIRPQRDGFDDYRGYAGRLESGVLRVGDAVRIEPAGADATITALDAADGPTEIAFAGQSIVVHVDRQLDVSRGDTIATAAHPPTVARELQVSLCWLSDQPLRTGGRYGFAQGTRRGVAIVDSIDAVLDLERMAPADAASTVELNTIARVTLRTSTPVAVDRYTDDRATGAVILIDEATNQTVGAALVRDWN